MNKVSGYFCNNELLINKQERDALVQLRESNIIVSGVITKRYAEDVLCIETLRLGFSNNLYYFTVRGFLELKKKSLNERNIEMERLIHFLECRKDVSCKYQVSDSLEMEGDVSLGYWFTDKGSRDFFFLGREIQCAILRQLRKYFSSNNN